MMKIRPLLTALIAGTLALTACDKPSAPKADTPAESTKTEVATPTISSNSYLDYQVNVTRTLVAITLNEDYELTAEQQSCLQSKDGDINYLSVLEPYFKGILSEEDFKEADAFFASDSGQKFKALIDAQLDNAFKDELPADLTDEEKAVMKEASEKPFFTKVDAHASKMSQEEALSFLDGMSAKEVERCGISAKQARPDDSQSQPKS